MGAYSAEDLYELGKNQKEARDYWSAYLQNAGFSRAETSSFLYDPNGPIAKTYAGTPLEVPRDDGESGLAKYFMNGVQNSLIGLYARDQLPDSIDMESPGFTKRFASGIGGMIADAPVYAAATALLAAAAAPFTGGSSIGLWGSMFIGGATFATVAGLKAAKMYDLMHAAQIPLDESKFDMVSAAALKEGLIGAMLPGAGRLGAMAGEGIARKMVAGGAFKGGVNALKARGAGSLAAETAMLGTAGPVMEGRMPETQDYVDNLTLMLGWHALGKMAGKNNILRTKAYKRGIENLMESYAYAGMELPDIVEAVKNDPVKLVELLRKNGIPEAWKAKLELLNKGSVLLENGQAAKTGGPLEGLSQDGMLKLLLLDIKTDGKGVYADGLSEADRSILRGLNLIEPVPDETGRFRLLISDKGMEAIRNEQNARIRYFLEQNPTYGLEKNTERVMSETRDREAQEKRAAKAAQLQKEKETNEEILRSPWATEEAKEQARARLQQIEQEVEAAGIETQQPAPSLEEIQTARERQLTNPTDMERKRLSDIIQDPTSPQAEIEAATERLRALDEGRLTEIDIASEEVAAEAARIKEPTPGEIDEGLAPEMRRSNVDRGETPIRNDQGEVVGEKPGKKNIPAEIERSTKIGEAVYNRYEYERLGADVKTQLQAAGLSEEEATNNSIIFAASCTEMAKLAGMEVQDYIRQHAPRFIKAVTSQFKGADSETRGGFDPIKKIIALFEKKDSSTALHEMSHFWLEEVRRLAESSEQAKVLLNRIAEIYGMKDLLAKDANGKYLVSGADWDALQEIFAREGEMYFREGALRQGVPYELRDVFETIRTWMKAVYQAWKDIWKIDGGDEAYLHRREVYDVFDSIIFGGKKDTFTTERQVTAYDVALAKLRGEPIPRPTVGKTVRRDDATGEQVPLDYRRDKYAAGNKPILDEGAMGPRIQQDRIAQAEDNLAMREGRQTRPAEPLPDVTNVNVEGAPGEKAAVPLGGQKKIPERIKQILESAPRDAQGKLDYLWLMESGMSGELAPYVQLDGYRQSGVSQSITSAETSLPNNDPALYKKKSFTKELKAGQKNLDIGGGKTEKATERLRGVGVENVKFDPFNVRKDKNLAVIEGIASGERYPTVTVSNVLNVIKEQDVRSNLILQAAKALEPNGKAFFSVYEKGKEGETSKGYQVGKKLSEYKPELEKWFGKVEQKDGMLIASEPKAEIATEQAAWWDSNPEEGGSTMYFQRKRIKTGEIIGEAAQALDVTARFGRGWSRAKYKPKAKTIDIRSENDFEGFVNAASTRITEIAFDNVEQALYRYDSELSKYVGKDTKESLGNYMQDYVLRPDKAKLNAPQLTSDLTSALLHNSPELVASLGRMRDTYNMILNMPATARIQQGISFGEEDVPGFFSRLFRRRQWHDIYRSAVNSSHNAERLFDQWMKMTGEETKASENPNILLRNLKGVAGLVNHFIEFGTFDFHTREVKGRSYRSIIKEAEKIGDLEDFSAYLTARRAVELANRPDKIDSGFPLDAAQQTLVEQAKFEPVARALDKFNEEVLTYVKESGLLSDDALAIISEMNKAYVPFHRIFIKDDGLFGLNMNTQRVSKKPLYNIEGSGLIIRDPLESVITNTFALMAAAEKNRVGQAIVGLAGKVAEGERWVEEVQNIPQNAPASKSDIIRALDIDNASKALIDALDVSSKGGAEVLSFWQGARGLNAKGDIAVWKDGKMKVYHVDPEIARVYNELDSATIGLFTKLIASGFSRFLRKGATLTPDFAVRNFFRDTITAGLVSRTGFLPGIDTFRGLIHVLRGDETYQAFLRSGGAQSCMLSLDHSTALKCLGNLKESGFFDKAWNVIKHPLDAMAVLSEVSENATRVGEFARGMKNEKFGEGIDRLIRSGYEARDILDFGRSGADTRGINAITAFFNANVQGVDRMFRAAIENPKRFVVNAALYIALPSVLMAVRNYDDEGLREIPKSQRDLFWITGLGDGENRVYIRIPKPFEAGVMFGSTLERTVEFCMDIMRDRNGGDVERTRREAYRGLGASMWGALHPNFIPTAAMPMIEHWANRSVYTGLPLVPAYLEGVLPEEKATEHNTQLSRALCKVLGHLPGVGDMLNPGPAVAENYVRGWSGGLGMYALQLIDAVARDAGVLPNEAMPEKTLADIPFIKAFIVRHPSLQAESIVTFYENYRKASAYSGTYNLGKREGRTELMEEYAAAGIYKAVEKPRAALSTITKAIRQVRHLPTLTPEEKRTAIEALYWQAIQVAKLGNDIFERAKDTYDELSSGYPMM